MVNKTRRKGQNVLEYTLILAVIVAAVLAAGKLLKGKVEEKVGKAGNKIESLGADRFMKGMGKKYG